MIKDLENIIFSANNHNFEAVALQIFHYQAIHNPVYKEYLSLLNIDLESINTLPEIPFLPISFFKSHKVLVDGVEPEEIFTSSGTTGIETSKHYVASIEVYRKSYDYCFEHFYGSPSKYCIIALLPSYLERKGSSLIYMADDLIRKSDNTHSGFFLNNIDELIETLKTLEQHNIPTILLGVTYALLNLANTYNLSLKNTIVMETGGMKGRGKEMVRSEVHQILKDAFGLQTIHSEYGMTELLSQAYSKGEGVFKCPPWMKVMARDPYDPFTILPFEKSGALNIIDLANIYSCSFIQTDDLGIVHKNDTFQVLGRMDGSQVRGCNLLVTG